MEQQRSSVGAMYLVVLVAASVLYVGTCAPGSLWQDSGMYQYRIWHNDIEGALGLALSHPLYHLIGIAVKQIPVGEFAYRVNLISAISGAIAVANLFLLIRLWLGANWPAIIGAIVFALSHTFWQHTAIAEVYTLGGMFLITELLLLLQYVRTEQKKYLYLLALANGLAMANHVWASIALACYVIFVCWLLIKKRINLGHVAVAAGLWVLGALPYEYLIVKDMIHSGDIVGTLVSAFFGRGWNSAVLNMHITGRMIKENIMFFCLNYPTPDILLFFVGLYVAYRVAAWRAFTTVLLAVLILYFVFAARYTVPDRYAFFVPFYCVVPIFVGAGFEYLCRKYNRTYLGVIAMIFAMIPVFVYAAAPALAEKAHVTLGTQRTIPYRNDYVYFLRPWQTCNNGPQRFAEEALKTAGDNAIIYADGTTVYPLLYEQQVKGKYTGITVLTGHASANNMDKYTDIDTLVATRPFYVVSPVKGYIPSEWLEKYSFKQQGVLWRMKYKDTQESKQ
jgi:hypothetical protein